jgi:hypothetical protein
MYSAVLTLLQTLKLTVDDEYIRQKVHNFPDNVREGITIGEAPLATSAANNVSSGLVSQLERLANTFAGSLGMEPPRLTGSESETVESMWCLQTGRLDASGRVPQMPSHQQRKTPRAKAAENITFGLPRSTLAGISTEMGKTTARKFY